MPYTMKDLTSEISYHVEHKLQQGLVVHPNFVTSEIMNNHQDIDGDDADFHQCASYYTVRDQVRRTINRYKPTAESVLTPDRQIILPGFERLQRAYVIDEIAVPIERLTSAQRRAKIEELRAMGRGCFQHADELERYDQEHPLAA